jgi:hypothetical protein
MHGKRHPMLKKGIRALSLGRRCPVLASAQRGWWWTHIGMGRCLAGEQPHIHRREPWESGNRLCGQGRRKGQLLAWDGLVF